LPQTNRHRPVTLGLDEARKRITSHRITQTESPRPNYPVRITSHEDPNEYPDERQNENIGTIRRSHQRERTSSACFVFYTQTNTGVRELPESKRPNGTNGRSSKPNYKGWVGRTAPNSLQSLHERLLRIPQETSGTLGSEATLQSGSWTTRPFLPTENTNFLSKRRLWTQMKPDETESI